MRHAGLWIVCLLAPLSTGDAKESPYAKGSSEVSFDDVPFALHIPDSLGDGAPHGLVLLEPGSLDDLEGVAAERYVLVAPHVPPERSSGLWSASEVKVIVRFVQHLVKELALDAAQVHAVAVDSTSLHGIFEMLVFRKRSPFVSATYVRSTPIRSSIPGNAKKRLAVLGYDWQPGAKDGVGMSGFIERFEKKVRVVELRHVSEPLKEPYFRYWLHATGGGYEPGHDLSFGWREGPRDLDALAAGRVKDGVGAMLYFFSKDDKDGTHGRTLQNRVFFDRAVRARGAAVAPFKYERSACEALFTALALTETPAVAVLDQKGAVVGRFEGRIKASSLAKALKKATPR